MYHKSHGYRLTGGSLYFGPNLVRKSQRDILPRDVLPTCPDSYAMSPLPTASISSDQREKHRDVIAADTCNDSAKKVLKAAPLISLEEAQRREVSRRNRAASSATKKEARVEREVSRLKREVAEIAWKRAQAKREEEESITRQGKEPQEKRGLEVPEIRKQEGQMLTAAVAAREDELVVAPTNWIVPLISLDEARHTEKAKRDAADTKHSVPLQSSLSSAVTSVNSLTVNAGNGNTTTLRLISLESARKRDQARQLEEEATRSRTRTLARAGTGLSHVPLITLTEARKQDALRRNASSRVGSESKSSRSTRTSRKPSYSSSPSLVNRVIETGSVDRCASRKDASTPREKDRWLALMSSAETHWTGLNDISGYSYHPHANGYP